MDTISIFFKVRLGNGMPVFYYTYHYNVSACLKLIPNAKCIVMNTASAFSGKEVLGHPKSVLT